MIVTERDPAEERIMFIGAAECAPFWFALRHRLEFFYYLTNPRPLSRGRRRADAYVLVMPEYDRATSGALKNAIDFLCNEWNNTLSSESRFTL